MYRELEREFSDDWRGRRVNLCLRGRFHERDGVEEINGKMCAVSELEVSLYTIPTGKITSVLLECVETYERCLV